MRRLRVPIFFVLLAATSAHRLKQTHSARLVSLAAPRRALTGTSTLARLRGGGRNVVPAQPPLTGIAICGSDP